MATTTLATAPPPPSSSTSTSNNEMAIFEAAEGSEIAIIWAQVKFRVVQLAGGSEKNLNQGLGIEDVLRFVEQAQTKDRKAAEKFGMVRKVFSKTLMCIQTVGGIVASGASQVFGPSQLAFNALTFVINAWQGYEGIFESLAGLLEKCVEFLDRLTYYAKRGMDIKLQRVACQHLQLFVEICDRTIKLRHSKLVKLKVFTKLFFLNDNDIQGLLDMMSSLVDKEGHLVAAQTFNFSSEAAANSREALVVGHRMDNKIDSLVEDKMDQKKEKDTQKRREIILKALAFDEEMMDKDKKEPNALWRSTYSNYRKLAVPGTGEWISTEPQFAAWEVGDVGVSPILVVQGGEGTGKSYLTSAIIKHLQSHSPNDVSGSRTSVAFYFLQGDNKDGSKTLNSLDMVSKSIVWQFAAGDASYQKSVASICERVQQLDPHEIWSQLLFDNRDRDKIDTIFFIVIDGLDGDIDEPFMKLLEKVASAHGGRRVRVLLTGNSTSIEELSKNENISFQTISLTDNNSKDIDKYIDTRMDQMEALKDLKRAGIPELRETIRQRLREETKGDYFKLDTNLSKISTLDSINDINEVLENAGKERSDQIIGEIEKLNKTRTSKEIQEINMVILWILYGRQWSPPSEIDELLYVLNGESSLLSLETKIKTKYSIFALDSDGDVAFKSTDIPTYLPLKGRLSENDIILAQSDSVQASEVAIVEHFLHTVCPPKLFEKFGFEKFFEQHKQSNRLNYVYQEDKDNAEIKLALICLRVLTEDQDEKSAFLRGYAATYLALHLQNVDLALVYRESKSEVGQRLLKLFTNEDCIDSLFSFDDWYSGWRRRETWLYKEDSTVQALRWFADSAVVSEISDEASKTWISTLLSESESDELLLKPIVKRLAFRWLRAPATKLAILNGFLCVLAFLSKIKNRKDKEIELMTAEPDIVKLEEIMEVETYAQDLLEVVDKDSLWEVEMAILYAQFSYPGEAEKRCRAALALDSTNWRASHELAKAITSNGEAIEILKGIAESFGEDATWLEDEDNKLTFSTVLCDLGDKYWDDKQYDEAVKVWARSIEQNPKDSLRNLEILQKYVQQERWTDAEAFLEVLRHDGTTHLRDMGTELASNEGFHEVLLQTAIAIANFEPFEAFYRDAIASALKDEQFDELYYLRFYYGTAVNHFPEREGEAIELWQLALKEDLPRSKLSKEDLLPALIMVLAPVYLRLARAADLDSDVAKDYLVRISDWLHDDVIERNLTYPPKLYLARYYHLQKDELRAKEATRRLMKLALEMLSDDSDDNDYDAYWRLLTVFIALEDDENAFAAWNMLAVTQEPKPEKHVKEVENPQVEEVPEGEPEHATEEAEEIITPAAANGTEEDGTINGSVVNGNLQPSEANGSLENQDETVRAESDEIEDHDDNGNASAVVTEEAAEKSKGEETDSESTTSSSDASSDESRPIAWCDGRCGDHWDHASEMYCCRDCIAYQFNQRCYDELQAGKLKRKICDKNHTFLYVPKWDEEKVERGKVRVGKEIFAVEEWKDLIRRKYIDFEGHVEDFDLAEKEE